MNKSRQKIECLLLMLLLTAATAWAGESFQAKVVSITDGDTIKVLHNSKQIKIRLYGIDTPEKRQAFGNRAKQFTSGQVFGQTVIVIPMDTDRYERTVALVLLQNTEKTVNEALVNNGFAWVYRKYCRAGFCPDWLEYEQAARTSKLGLWE